MVVCIVLVLRIAYCVLRIALTNVYHIASLSRRVESRESRDTYIVHMYVFLLSTTSYVVGKYLSMYVRMCTVYSGK